MADGTAIPNLLIIALEYYRSPARYPNLANSRAPLPPGLTELLAAFSGVLSDEHIPSTAQTL